MTQQTVKPSGQTGSPETGSALLSRKVHKADREKLRRDKLNEQFAELAAVLDPEKPKLDKASILGDSLQAVRDLRNEIKRLQMERVSLFDESQDLTREKTDLAEEKAALKKQTDELELQVQQILKATGPLSSGPQPATSAAQIPSTTLAFSQYAPGFHLRPHIPALSNPFVYLTTPSASQVERPCAQYPLPDAVPDFLSKVQSNVHSNRVYRPQPLVADQFLRRSSDQDDSDIQLHLGQPRPLDSNCNSNEKEQDQIEVDTDLQLKVPASKTVAVAHASS